MLHRQCFFRGRHRARGSRPKDCALHPKEFPISAPKIFRRAPRRPGKGFSVILCGGILVFMLFHVNALLGVSKRAKLVQQVARGALTCPTLRDCLVTLNVFGVSSGRALHFTSGRHGAKIPYAPRRPPKKTLTGPSVIGGAAFYPDSRNTTTLCF